MLRKIWNSLERYSKQRAEYIMLYQMTDRELKDIGISRCEIRQRFKDM